MAASNEYTEWHLTARGWERGSERIDFQETIIKDPPTDRELSYKYFEFMSSGYSKLEKGLNEIFRSESSEVIEKLLKDWGSCPERL